MVIAEHVRGDLLGLGEDDDLQCAIGSFYIKRAHQVSSSKRSGG